MSKSNSVPIRFRDQLVGALQEMVERDDAALGEYNPGMAGAPAMAREAHRGALELLKRHVAGVGLDHPVLTGLYDLQVATGTGDDFAPTTEQARVLGVTGLGPESTRGTEELFAELLAAGVSDVHERWRIALQTAQQELDAANARLGETEALAAQLDQARAENAELTGRLDEALGEAEYVKNLLRFFRESLGLAGPTDKQVPPPRKRRERVPDHEGIYQRENADGSITYEAYHRDGDGRKHFTPIGPDLEEAIAAREALTAGEPWPPVETPTETEVAHA